MAKQMTRCGFCRRLTCERTEAGSAGSEQEAEPSNGTPLLPEDFKIEEAYCRDCERFYQQLVTFGRGDFPAAGKHVLEPPVHEILTQRSR